MVGTRAHKNDEKYKTFTKLYLLNLILGKYAEGKNSIFLKFLIC